MHISITGGYNILLMDKHSHADDDQTKIHLQTKNRKPEANWGSSVDAFTFNSALSSIQVLRRDFCFECFIDNILFLFFDIARKSPTTPSM